MKNDTTFVLRTTQENSVRALNAGPAKVRDLQAQFYGHFGDALRGGILAGWKHASADKPSGLEWFVDNPVEFKKLSELTEEEEIKLANCLSARVAHIESGIEKSTDLDERDKRMLLAAFEQALYVPTEDDILLAGDTPILVNWGAIPADASKYTNPVERLLKKAKVSATLVISVTDSDNNPAAGERIHITGKFINPIEINADENGTATVYDMPPGESAVIAVTDGVHEEKILEIGHNIIHLALPSEPTSTTVRGQIFVSRQGNGEVSGLHVELLAKEPENDTTKQYNITTKTDGSADLPPLRENTRITASINGFKGRVEHTLTESNRNVFLEVSQRRLVKPVTVGIVAVVILLAAFWLAWFYCLLPWKPDSCVRSVVAENRSLEIVVVDSSGQPVPGASLSLTTQTAEKKQSVSSNQQGRAEFENLTAGDILSITATKEGYAAATKEQIACCNETLEVTLNRKQPPERTVIIKVFNGNGRPIADAVVSTTIDGQNVRVSTNNSGESSLDGLMPSNSYSVTAQMRGYEPKTILIESCCKPESYNITLRESTPLLTVDVFVVDQDNQPVSDATVSAVYEGTAETLNTNSEGQATFDEVPKGEEFIIEVNKTGYILERFETKNCCQIPISVILKDKIKYNFDGVKKSKDDYQSGLAAQGVVPAGSKNGRLWIDDNGADDDIQIFLPTGEHLVGTPLDDEVWGKVDISTPTDVREKLFQMPGSGFDNDAVYDASNLHTGGRAAVHGITFYYTGDLHQAGNSEEEITFEQTPKQLLLYVIGSGKFWATSSWEEKQLVQ